MRVGRRQRNNPHVPDTELTLRSRWKGEAAESATLGSDSNLKQKEKRDLWRAHGRKWMRTILGRRVHKTNQIGRRQCRNLPIGPRDQAICNLLPGGRNRRIIRRHNCNARRNHLRLGRRRGGGRRNLQRPKAAGEPMDFDENEARNRAGQGV
jgi:hypothetical protein